MGFGVGSPKKTALKEGASKKIREKGGHVKYYLYWRGVVGKNLVTGGGGVMQLPNDRYLVKNKRSLKPRILRQKLL